MSTEFAMRLRQLKEERKAIILAHYYQVSEIQDIADFVGDSLELAKKAAQTDAQTIVFCGVRFMAETAKILNPSKTVLLPDMDAGCSLVDGCPPDKFAQFIASHPGAYVITYVNSSAEVKALSDVVCTSSNAVDIVRKAPADCPIIFAPDKNLGKWVAEQSGRDLILWDGSCQVHENFSEEAFMELWSDHKDYEVVAHPETPDYLLKFADFVGSTSALLNRVQVSPAPGFIVLTEMGIFYKMRALVPGKVFLDVPGKVLGEGGCKLCNICPHMRLNTLDKVLRCMETGTPEIYMEESLREKALIPLKRMLELS